MEISKKCQDGIITFSLNGWLDTISSPQLGEEFEAIDSATAIILDFENVEYIASSGLRQVVACHKKAKELNAQFSLINVCSDAMGIFKLTGLDKKLNIQAK